MLKKCNQFDSVNVCCCFLFSGHYIIHLSRAGILNSPLFGHNDSFKCTASYSAFIITYSQAATCPRLVKPTGRLLDQNSARIMSGGSNAGDKEVQISQLVYIVQLCTYSFQENTWYIYWHLNLYRNRELLIGLYLNFLTLSER